MKPETNIDQDLERVESFGYSFSRRIDGRGIVALIPMSFTVGLAYNIDPFEWGGYEGRYCYSSFFAAYAALTTWNGQDDPPGEWIKHKGRAGQWSRVPDQFELEERKRRAAE